MRIASDFSNAANDIDAFRENFRSGIAAAAGVSRGSAWWRHGSVYIL